MHPEIGFPITHWEASCHLSRVGVSFHVVSLNKSPNPRLGELSSSGTEKSDRKVGEVNQSVPTIYQIWKLRPRDVE